MSHIHQSKNCTVSKLNYSKTSKYDEEQQGEDPRVANAVRRGRSLPNSAVMS